MIGRLIDTWYAFLAKLGVQTLGVKVMIFEGNTLLLVRHRFYPSQWMLPGGGMKKGEQPREAARREVQEELGIIVHSFSSILGVYENKRAGRKDTVAVLIARLFEHPSSEHRSLEIKEVRFFNLRNLPPNVSPATLRRIEEYQSGKREFYRNW